MLFRSRSLSALVFLVLMSVGAAAQTQTQSSPPSTQPAAETEQPLKPEELEALVAPIALYPDSLLSLVLMASTYPLEVVQADRWLSSSKLKGDQLKAAVDKQGWDESVKSLVATPTVLTMMSTKLDWTQKLGDAVLAQQEDVMDAVQRLRARAQSNDKLKSTKEQTVTTTQVDNRPVIAIAQTDPNTVYVPVYDPGVAYGTWPYAEYPPYYWPDYWAGSGYLAGGVLATGLVFGAGYALGRWASGGNWWGGGVNWGNRNLIANRPVNINNIGNNWQHRPEHRHGVRYNNANVAQKFAGGNNLRSSAGQRQDFRGKDGNRPGGDRAGLGDRDRPGGDRAGVGDRDRPGGGDRSAAGNRDRAGAGSAKGDRGGKRDAARPSTGGKSAAAKGSGKGANRAAANRPSPGARPGGAGGPRRDAAFGNMQPGRVASAQSMRGHASLGAGGRSFAGGGGTVGMGGGGFRGGMGGGGFRGGGGGGFRGGGGGRRSDVALKQDVNLLGYLDNGLSFYRFRYNGDDTVYVGVMAQEVQKVMPQAVTRDGQGFLRVAYDRLGLPFQTYDQWIASRMPALARECQDSSSVCRNSMR
jgi:Protein of unknown function (DUF3300)